MTIAIGVRSVDGIVFAADRQATWGLQKTNEGKIQLAWRIEPYGGIVVTGAGASSSLDAFADIVTAWFRGTPASELDANSFPASLEQLHCDFYQQKVMPFAGHDIGRADYSLILGHSGAETHPKLWSTDGFVMNTESNFAAVGVGAATAKAILAKLWILLPTEEAITLAAFVIDEVKRGIDGCGLSTDIYSLSRGRPWIVPDEDVKEMETAFDLYRRGERNHFHECMGHAPSDHLTYAIQAYQGYRDRVREIVMRLASQRLKGRQ